MVYTDIGKVMETTIVMVLKAHLIKTMNKKWIKKKQMILPQLAHWADWNNKHRHNGYFYYSASDTMIDKMGIIGVFPKEYC